MAVPKASAVPDDVWRPVIIPSPVLNRCRMGGGFNGVGKTAMEDPALSLDVIGSSRTRMGLLDRFDWVCASWAIVPGGSTLHIKN